MKHHPSQHPDEQTHAKSLLADIMGSPAVALPRRETLIDWLQAYLLRSDSRGYVAEPSEGTDLNALERFLRSNGVPAVIPA
jgi:hypothetical protein